MERRRCCRRLSTIAATTALDSETESTINGLSSPQSKATSGAYSAHQITVLSGLEPVRKRPGMYIGSTGPDGLHHLVYEVLDNSVDEALAGHASLISVVLHDDNCCTISDDGRGIPTDVHPTTAISALETVLTVLHAGGKFDNSQQGSGYKVSGGLHGVGISVVNALSDFVEVRVDRKVGTRKDAPTERKMMRFERGVPVGELRDVDITIDDDKTMAAFSDGGWEDIVFQTNDSKAMPSSLGGEDDGINGVSGKSEATSKSITKSQSAAKKRGGRASPISIDDHDSSSLEYKTSLVKRLSSERTSGTTVTFLPDISVFKGSNGKPGITFDQSRLAMRME